MKFRYVLGAVAVLSAATFEYHARQQDKAELGRLRGELGRLSQQAASRTAVPQFELLGRLLNQQPAGQTPAAAESGAKGAPATPASTASASGASEPKPPLTQQQIQHHYEGLFYKESADPRWASAAETLAQDKLRRALATGSEVRAVECRSSLCRIETSHSSREEYQQFIQQAFLNPQTQLWNGGMHTGPIDEASDSEGRVVAVTYLAKEGQPLSVPN